MRAPLATLLLMIVAVPVCAQHTVHRAHPARPDVTVRVFNLAGHVTIVGTAVDSVTVTGTVEPGGRLVMGGTDAGIKVGIDGPSGDTTTVEAQLVVRVPSGARVWVKSASAGIDVSGVRGELDLATISGAVRISGRPATVTAESIDGPVAMVGLAPVTRLKTADGRIEVDSATGDLTATSVSGRIEIRAAAPLALGHVESVTGPVHFAGPVDVAGALEIQTHESLITVELPRSQRATLDAMAFSGKVMSGFPGGERRAGPGTPSHFDVNGGGARLTLRSLKGGIVIRALP